MLLKLPTLALLALRVASVFAAEVDVCLPVVLPYDAMRKTTYARVLPPSQGAFNRITMLDL